MKESITKFDLSAAFKALDEIEMPVAAKSTLTESTSIRRNHDALVEEYYDVNDNNDMEAAAEDREAEINKAKLARIEKIVDLDADSADDILPSYVGKLIMQCPQCMTMFYKDPEDIEYSETDDTLVNVGEKCQHCGHEGGYTLVGKVDEVSADEAANYNMSDFDENELNLDFEEPAEEPKEEAPAEETSEEKINLEPVETEEEPEEEKKEEAFKISAGDALVETYNRDITLIPCKIKCYDNEYIGYLEDVRDWGYAYLDDENAKKYMADMSAADPSSEFVIDGDYIYVENDNDEDEYNSHDPSYAYACKVNVNGKTLWEFRDDYSNTWNYDFEGVEELPVEESVNLNKEFHDIDKKHASENDSENLSLNESKELDDQMKTFNGYVEYLQKMIEQEEEALEKASNDLVKKAIQRRIDAFKADLDEALPNVIKEETPVEEAPVEEQPVEEQPVEEVPAEEEVKESVNLNKEFHDINKKNASENDSENLTLNESISGTNIPQKVIDQWVVQRSVDAVDQCVFAGFEQYKNLTPERYGDLLDTIGNNGGWNWEDLKDWYINECNIPEINDVSEEDYLNFSATLWNAGIDEAEEAISKFEAEHAGEENINYKDLYTEVENIFRSHIQLAEGCKECKEELTESVAANKAAEVDAAEKNIDISGEKNGADQPSNNLADANVAPKEEIPNELQEAVEIKVSVEEVPGTEDAIIAEPLPAAEVEIPAVAIEEPVVCVGPECEIPAEECQDCEEEHKEECCPDCEEKGECDDPECENPECPHKEVDDEFKNIVANAKAKEAVEEAEMADEAADEIADEVIEDEEKEETFEEALNLTEAEENSDDISFSEINELVNSPEYASDVSEAEAEAAISELGGDVDDIDIDNLEDVEENYLKECITNSLTNVYENVKSFDVTDIELNEGVMTIYGNIEFNSGKTKATKYVFTESKVLNRNTVVLTGTNRDLAEDCEVTLEGALLEGKTALQPSKLSYKYSINNNLIEGFGAVNRK